MLFFEEIVEQDSEIFMGSLDVDTLENNERVGLTKRNLKNFHLLLQKKPILFLMESCTRKSIELLCVDL